MFLLLNYFTPSSFQQ